MDRLTAKRFLSHLHPERKHLIQTTTVQPSHHHHHHCPCPSLFRCFVVCPSLTVKRTLLTTSANDNVKNLWAHSSFEYYFLTILINSFRGISLPFQHSSCSFCRMLMNSMNQMTEIKNHNRLTSTTVGCFTNDQSLIIVDIENLFSDRQGRLFDSMRHVQCASIRDNEIGSWNLSTIQQFQFDWIENKMRYK